MITEMVHTSSFGITCIYILETGQAVLREPRYGEQEENNLNLNLKVIIRFI